jgi:hypothetical protein
MKLPVSHKEYVRRYTRVFVALAIVLLFSAAFSPLANAQRPGPTLHFQLRHLAPDAMNAADISALQNRQNELVRAARIYGYNLETGNWAYEQTLCAPLPQTILLHYRQQFSDGTASFFTALVPRGQGRIRVVPVLYHNATPFLPAPRNPRNYVLFNELVPPVVASRGTASNGKWLELSACYAEMTGANINLPSGATVNIGVASAPTATIRVDPQDKTARVTLADRETTLTYRVWSIAFNRNGRVTAAGTEEYPVYPAKSAPEAIQPTVTAQIPEASQPEQTTEPVILNALPEQTATLPANQPEPRRVETKQLPAAGLQPAITTIAGEQTSEPGWKFISPPPQPPSRITPNAPPPLEKTMPEPPNPWGKSSPSNPPPQ